MNNDCIFCKIVAGEMPCHKVFEDDDILAFMDIGPVSKGHTLVIPKQHCNPLMDTPQEILQKVIVAVQKIATAMVKSLDTAGINITQANGAAAGQAVPHLHFHVIPRFQECKAASAWTPGEYSTVDEMNEFAEKIRACIETG